MITYAGGCHCGQVRFSLTKPKPISQAVACNCSLCAKKGILLGRAEESELTVTKGQDALSLYQFGTKTASHWFCRNCGIHVMTRPRMSPERFAVNVRCLDDFPALQEGLAIVPFDGQNHPKDQTA